MPNELNKALLAFQKEAPTITLDGENPHFKSKYPSLAGIMEKIRPVLTKHGLVVVQAPTIVGGEPALTTHIVHASTNENMESTMLLLPAKSDPQGQGSALTYARRYMVLAMLGLVGDEDDDANAASNGDAVEQQLAAKGTGFVGQNNGAKQKAFLGRLLKSAGLTSNQVEGINRYLEQLPSDRVRKAINGANDKDQKKADDTIGALVVEADKFAKAQPSMPFDEDA